MIEGRIRGKSCEGRISVLSVNQVTKVTPSASAVSQAGSNARTRDIAGRSNPYDNHHLTNPIQSNSLCQSPRTIFKSSISWTLVPSNKPKIVLLRRTGQGPMETNREEGH